jgi:Dos2-interacting transcription regulator of RNA-Pol-II
MLTILHPIFTINKKTKNTTTIIHKFPIRIMFNAISLYYPIQFNPPPNNIHGITKQILCNSIISIMSCTLYEPTTMIIPIDDNDTTNNNNNDSMIRLSIGIIIESLISTDDDCTIKERIDIFNDLNTCLFNNTLITNNESSSSTIQYLSSIDINTLSNALINIHDNTIEFNLLKDLVTKCRLLVCKIAYETELLIKQCPTLWQSFVQIPLQTIISSLNNNVSSTSIIHSSRIGIAYIANICSCGGIETLRYGLQIGLLPILQQLTITNNKKSIRN